MIAGNEQLHRPAILAKHLPPRPGMEFHLARLASVRHVAAMHHGIDMQTLEIFKRSGEIFDGPVRIWSACEGARAKVRIAQYAKDKIRLTAMFPAQRGRKQAPPAEGKRRRARQKLSP